MKNILVTGGAGYIGSHTCLSLLNKNYKVFVIDSFINSSQKSMERILEINKNSAINHNKNLSVFEGDITDMKFLKKVFLELENQQIKIDGVGVTSTWTGLDLSTQNKPNWKQSEAGAAFQFTEHYSGPGLQTHTIIQRETTVQSVTESTSIFSN